METITRKHTLELEYIRTTQLQRFETQPRMDKFLSLNSTKQLISQMGLDRKQACIVVGNKSYLLSTLVSSYFLYAKKINNKDNEIS